MDLLLFLIILVLVSFLVIWSIEKFLDIKKIDISETPGKQFNRWGGAIILVAFLCTYLFALTLDSVAILRWHGVLFFTIFIGFRALVEWKYTRESKQYVSTLISLAMFYLFILVHSLFF